MNGAAALHNSSADSIENETITWNWNPQASSKLNFEHNGYGQKTNRNKCNATDEASALASTSTAANGRNLSIWSHDDTDTDETGVKNSNFWSKVLFNNNGNGGGGSSSSSSTNSGSGKDQRRTANNLLLSSSNTAVIFNSIISNLKDHHPKSIVSSDMDMEGNATAAPGSAAAGAIQSGSDSNFQLKSKNSSQEHRIAKNRLDRKNDASPYDQVNGDGSDGGVFRLSLDNDLNAANSTFLRALNDLHLDYNDLTAASNRQEQNESNQSKERYD